MKYITATIVLSAATFLGTPSAFAAGDITPTMTPTPTSVQSSNCQPIYGGGVTCVQVGNLLINKTVANPQTNVFVDNLGINDPKYQAEQTVPFQISVTNTGGQTISKATIKDTLPQYVTFVSGQGNFDQNSKVLTFEVSDLKAGETRTFSLSAKVVGATSLPQDQGITCVINQAKGEVNGQTSQDNAGFCIEKKVLGEKVPVETKGGLKVFPAPVVTTTPPTGPEAAILFALIPTGLAGAFLRKKAQLS